MIDVQSVELKAVRLLAIIGEITKLHGEIVSLFPVTPAVNAAGTAHAAAAPSESGTFAPGLPAAWNTSEEAIGNYDAAQLVALRGDHRADNHDPAPCGVCALIAKRLGGL